MFVKELFCMRLGNFQTFPKHPGDCRLASLHPYFSLCLNKLSINSIEIFLEEN